MLVGYARVSTDAQDTTMQTDALTSAGCERIFQETASGSREDRPQLRAAIDYVRAGDTIVVWKLDRLARSLSQLIRTVEELERREIGIRSLTETIDSTTAGGRLVFHIFGALAEFERAVIRERTREGLFAARRQGRVGGRKPSLAPRDLKAAQALLRDPSISFTETARRVGVSPATLYRYLPGGRSASASS